MAAALEINWDEVKELYVQGVAPTELCKRFCIKLGTLGAKANRLGWTRARRAQTIVTKAIDRPNTALTQLAMMVSDAGANDMQKRGQQMLERLARDCERTALRLEKFEPDGLEGEELRERTLKMLTDRTMRVFGLDHHSPGTVLMFGLAARVLETSQKSIDLPK